jgi:hypothetical protein
VIDVDFNIGTVTSGYGPMERDDHVLKSISISATHQQQIGSRE